MNVTFDDAFQFGLGVFETICLHKGQPVLLDWHLERMNASLHMLGIGQEIVEKDVLNWLEKHNTAALPPLHAMKIMVSEHNKVVIFRTNPYTPDVLRKGFRLNYSRICRNETSPLVYHKTMNYGDNILEKRRTHDMKIDEFLFLNSKGEICEGSTTNVFFVKNEQIYTPALSSGLLPGIMRRFILEHFQVNEKILYPEDVKEMDECFVTNSLMGIMPVTNLAGVEFADRTITQNCMFIYDDFMRRYTGIPEIFYES